MTYCGGRGRWVDTMGRISALGGLMLTVWPLTSAVCRAGEPKETVISIDFAESHDRLDPDPRPDILRNVHIEATLSPNGQVHESLVATVGGRKRRMAIMNENEQDAKLGDASPKIVWRVEGPHKLQRLVVGQQFLTMFDVEIGSDAACSVQIKYLQQKGYSGVIMRRSDNGELAHFSLPKVLNSSCSIR